MAHAQMSRAIVSFLATRSTTCIKIYVIDIRMLCCSHVQQSLLGEEHTLDPSNWQKSCLCLHWIEVCMYMFFVNSEII